MTNRYGEELKQKLADNLKEIQWKEYLKCSNLPNPKIEQDLNTFLMLWKDEKLVFDDLPSLNTLYDQLPAGVKLMEELQIEKAELIAAGNHAKADLIQNYITKLSQILLDKCDMTTHQIIQNVHRYSRESTENFQAEGSENAFKFGLWTNLTNNPM